MRTMVVAGRRIDAEDAEAPRFPLARVHEVRSRIREAMLEYGPAWLLPFGVDAFRKRSVTDRPSDWGPRFDRRVHELQLQGNVIDLDLNPAGEDVYEYANLAIIDQALSLSDGDAAQVRAIVIWDGRPRGPSPPLRVDRLAYSFTSDLTLSFGSPSKWCARDLEPYDSHGSGQRRRP